VKTPIRIGVGRTKKNEKFQASERITGRRKKNEKSTKKNEKFRPQKGSQEGANERKIYERKRKM